MPEVTPVWIDGYYDNYDQAYAAAQEGMNGDLLEGIPQPVLTLDQIEAWLKDEYVRLGCAGSSAQIMYRQTELNDLLAQVQAWRQSGAPHNLNQGEVMNEGHDFGWALATLKEGKRVARMSGWNGKGMFLFLVPGSTFKVNRPPLLGIYPEGTEIRYQPHIDMKTAQGTVVPWLASQSDMLAEDWAIAVEA